MGTVVAFSIRREQVAVAVEQLEQRAVQVALAAAAGDHNGIDAEALVPAFTEECPNRFRQDVGAGIAADEQRLTGMLGEEGDAGVVDRAAIGEEGLLRQPLHIERPPEG
jgi:hypothetical protein